MQVSFSEAQNCPKESFVRNYGFHEAEEENSIFVCAHGVKITLWRSHRIRPAGGHCTSGKKKTNHFDNVMSFILVHTTKA